MRRFFYVILSVFLLLLSLGCTKTVKTTVNKTIDSDNIGYSVKDSTGEIIHFTKKPERILSMSSSVDEILLDLTDSKRIIALSYLSDNPSVSAICDKAKSVKGRVRGNNIESIIAYHPDLIILPDWVDMTSVQTLKDMKINVYIFKTPNNIKEIEEAIEHIAKLTGDEEKGDILVKNMEKTLATVHDKVKNIPKDKIKTIVAFSQMGTIGAKNTTFDNICTLANVTNLVSRTDITKYDTLTKEQVISLNPDVFLLPTWDQSGKGDLKKFIEEIKDDPAYSNVKAIKNNDFVSIHDKYLFSFSQYAVYAVEELAEAVYPEIK